MGKECEICTKVFSPVRVWQKYCSMDCKREATSRRNMKHYEKAGERKPMRRFPKTGSCRFCGTSLDVDADYKRRYCDSGCRNKYWNTIRGKKCPICDIRFSGTAMGVGLARNRRVCSKACERKWRVRGNKTANVSQYAKAYVDNSPCAACGESRQIDAAHIVSKKDGGGWDVDNILPLCPTHHRIFDRCPELFAEKEELGISATYTMKSPYHMAALAMMLNKEVSLVKEG